MKLLKLAFSYFPSQYAYAHCDIPCGVYDPTPLQIAAHTVLRMTNLLGEHDDNMHDVARIVNVKEEHGGKVEEEIGTLKNDYFKDEHYASYPELKQLLKDVVALSVKTRQTINVELSKELIEKAMQIAEIFYKTKNVTPVRVKSLYPTEGQIVTYRE
jgi:nickel superoxide dismutase